VKDGVGLTETGEPVCNLPLFASSGESYLWVTIDPAALLTPMVDAFGHLPSFTYQVTASHEDLPEGVPYVVTTKLTRFGFTNGRNNRPPKGIRRDAQHVVWTPQDMMRNPLEVLGGNSHAHLLRFATDLRDWCKQQDIPLPTSLSGIGASLLRDSRFWPNARGRVPRATNERIRPYLPGVYSELRTATNQRRNAVAIDQKRAYHRAAQEVANPDPSTLFARGYFMHPDSDPARRAWTKPGCPVYERTVKQPGLLALWATSRPTHSDETRAPATDFSGTQLIYLWTNELGEALDRGLQVHHLVAAWTSTNADPGLPVYGKWALGQIDEADEYRRQWLKPTLHTVYGLLAARTRKLKIGHRHGRGVPATYVLGRSMEVPVMENALRHSATTVNVAGLGTLQAEIRLRSMKMANRLLAEGVEVLHVHADGLHVAGYVPLIEENDRWSMDTLTSLVYLDRVSYMSKEVDCLPGRDARLRADLRRHHAKLLTYPLPGRT
jgi:hypothetical protein